MGIRRCDITRLETDIAKCVSLIESFSKVMNAGDKEISKAQLYHLITALIGFQLWGTETTLSRTYHIHGAIPMVNVVKDSIPRKITLPKAIEQFGESKVIYTTKKGTTTFFKLGRLGEYNQKEWPSEEEETIREIISLRKQFGNQTYAILGLSNPIFLTDSVSWLIEKTINSLEKSTRYINESRSKSEINKELKYSARLVRSALDKIEAYREICPQMKEQLRKNGIDLPIGSDFPGLESLEKVFRSRREEISELRHIAFYKFGIGSPGHDRSHVGDLAELNEMDIADFFEYVELVLSTDEIRDLEKYLKIQVTEASSKFDKSIFKVLLAMAQNGSCYND